MKLKITRLEDRIIPARVLSIVCFLILIICTPLKGNCTNSYPTLYQRENKVCTEITDIPLTTKVKAAPPLVMFLLDDSGSMLSDVLCPEFNGFFNGKGTIGNWTTSWKSQYYTYNGIYYNPNRIYEPWELYSNANPNYPKKHPLKVTTHNLNSEFARIDGVSIPIAHYYDWSSIDNAPYLVIVRTSIKYFKVTNYGAGNHGQVFKLVRDYSPPPDIRVADSYINVRQNIANWYSYYRTRELVAKAAIGKVIAGVSNTRMGIHTINHSVISPVQNIKVEGKIDKTNYVIRQLYQVSAKGDTPLRRGLEDIGQYFHADDRTNGNIGESPYSSEMNGGACQKAFAIVMTDGYYNGRHPRVGNADGDNKTPFDGYPFADSYSNSLADVSMYYYEQDLSKALDNNLSSSSNDTAKHQHMITYTISYGLQGTQLVNTTCPEDPATCPRWPDPITSKKKIDDLWHCAVNGRGAYYTATDTDELISALTDVMTDIGEQTKTGAAVTLNTQTLESDTHLYQAFFDSNDWSGDLKAYEVSISTGEVNQAASWSAKKELDALNWNSNRQILTYNGATGVTFRYSSLTATQRNLLDPIPAKANLLVNYLRGDTSHEISNGGRFRNRKTRLGDIVNSSPSYHEGVVYIGANDGMLHAFDSTNGKELFAYIPNIVFKHLKDLSKSQYDHRFFVNGNIRTVKTGTKSYLVGGLGKGGRGYYGIDITNAKNLSESTIPAIWEYPQTYDADMGFSFSDINIVKSNYNNGEPVAIFGNGYDSPSGTAALYILKLDGTLLRKINTNVGNTTTECNGLSNPLPVDVDFDSLVDYVYAGDLQGNLWKFDLTSTDHNDWSIPYYDGYTYKPLVQVKDKFNKPQPITGTPDAMLHCERRFKGLLIVFGTGKYISVSDIEAPQTQTIYGIYDWADAWTASDENAHDKYYGTLMPPEGNSQIRQFSNISTSQYFAEVSDIHLLEQTQTILSNGWRETTKHEADWFNPSSYASLEAAGDEDSYSQGLHAGWFFDLPLQGERVISRVQIRNGNSIIVSITPSSSPCSAGGSSIIHIMNNCNGGQPDSPQFDTDGDGDIDMKDDDKTGKLLDNIFFAPNIIDNKLYFDKDKTELIRDEPKGLYYIRIFK